MATPLNTSRDDTTMSRPIVVCVDGLPEAARRRMEQLAEAASASVCFLPENDEWRSAPANMEAAVGLPPVRLVEQTNSLSFVQLHSSGFDAYFTPALLDRPKFAIANARGITAQAVAEHCLSMMFAFSRRTLSHADNQQKTLWQRAISYDVLHGKTVTILGTGAIGSALGAMCKGIGMRVIATQRKPECPSWADAVFPFEDLPLALRSAHHLALALPSLSAEKPLIGAEALKLLPEGSYVYNVGRASVLDYAALASALDSSHLAGAGLDVFPSEPLSSVDPLWSRRNVIVSPHAGGRFAGEMDALADLFIDNLKRYLSGAPLRNVVLGTEGQR